MPTGKGRATTRASPGADGRYARPDGYIPQPEEEMRMRLDEMQRKMDEMTRVFQQQGSQQNTFGSPNVNTSPTYQGFGDADQEGKTNVILDEK